MADLLGVNPAPTGASEMDERQVAKAALDAAEEQLRSLCASHAATFVAVERRGASLASALEDLQKSVKEVEPQVSNVQGALDDGDSLASLSEKHRIRRRTLLQHSSLLELLELPSLCDACVRSNLYEEALSIASFANTLERRHTDKNAVVMRVIAQIRSRQSDLRRHLLFRLKQSLTMPVCLEIVTALRRLNGIDLERHQSGDAETIHAAMEMRLQVDFLEARDVWLESAPARNGGTSAGHSEQLLDAIERNRTRIFEIATQFNSIFRASPGKDSSKSADLLSMWASRRIDLFLKMLAQNMVRVSDPSVLRDALEACLFFSSSMGRLGLDFTSQLPFLFEPKMTALVTSHWTDGVSQFEETLKVCRDAGVASPLSAQTATASAVESSPDQPPRMLLSCPPMSRLVNHYLSGLNELRRCLLPGIFGKLRVELLLSLASVKASLDANQRAVNAPGLRGATELRDAASHMIALWENSVERYLKGALEVALGNYVVAKELLKKEEPEPETEEVAEVQEENGEADDGEQMHPAENEENSSSQQMLAPSTENEKGSEGNVAGDPDGEDDGDPWNENDDIYGD